MQFHEPEVIAGNKLMLIDDLLVWASHARTSERARTDEAHSNRRLKI